MSESENSAVPPVLQDDNGDDVASGQMEELLIEEVMERLEERIAAPDFVPYLDSPFVTINGNEESCGPSFSDSASTVMASIDMGGTSILDLVGPRELREIPKVEGATFFTEEAVDVSGGVADVEDREDEWLPRVLSGPAFEFHEAFGL